MQRAADAVIDELFLQCAKLNDARDAGDAKYVPWLDCARSYGLSEKFVGEYLRANDVAPEDVYVSSKWGYTYVADWQGELGEGEPHEIKDHSLKVRNFAHPFILCIAHILLQFVPRRTS